jgi:hypothetical protein
VFSGALTTISVAVCTVWGWRCLRRMPDITLRMRSKAALAS